MSAQTSSDRRMSLVLSQGPTRIVALLASTDQRVAADPAWQQSLAQPARANLEGPTRLLPFSQELINARPLTKLGDGAHPASTDQRVAADHDGQQSLVQPARANVDGPTRLSLPFWQALMARCS